MDISLIDSRFKLSTITEPDIEWHEISEPEFSLHGVFYEPEVDRYIRMPRAVSETVSDGVHKLAAMSAGGRLRFSTDSPYIALQCIAPACWPLSHMPLTGSHGFGLFVDGIYRNMYVPNHHVLMRAIFAEEQSIAFDGSRKTYAVGLQNCTLYFPLYGGVRKIKIGLKKGCKLQAAPAYKYPKPVVFYGSSIFQGACAAYPGSDLEGMLSQWLDFDYVNLGFSGNGKAEPEMNAYLASLDPSVYVLDSDYTATPEELPEKHYRLYETVRNAHKHTPILLLCKPDTRYDPNGRKRASIVYDVYCKAKAQGDQKVWFIDGESMYGEFERNACAVDTCHPTNLGFYRMAKAVAPVLEEALKKV